MGELELLKRLGVLEIKEDLETPGDRYGILKPSDPIHLDDLKYLEKELDAIGMDIDCDEGQLQIWIVLDEGENTENTEDSEE